MRFFTPEHIQVELYEAIGLKLEVDVLRKEKRSLLQISLGGYEVFSVPLEEISVASDLLQYLPPHLHAQNLLLQKRYAILRRLREQGSPEAEEVFYRDDLAIAQMESHDFSPYT